MAYDPGTDVVAIVARIDTGHNSAGNGGDGHNTGALTNDPTASFDTHNNAYGSDVGVTTGDHVHQRADWDAGGATGGTATATASDPSYDPSSALARATGGHAVSSGDQYSASGGDTSTVHANTTAYQDNFAAFDQHSNMLAGNGGYGGDGNTAVGGDAIINLDHFTV